MAMKATKNKDLLVVIRPSWPKRTRKSKRDARVNKKEQEGCPREQESKRDAQGNKKARGMPKLKLLYYEQGQIS